MARSRAVIAGAAVLCLLASACEGNGALFTSALGASPAADAGPVTPELSGEPTSPSPNPAPSSTQPSAQNSPGFMQPVSPAPVADAGAPIAPDAGVVVTPPSEVVVDGAATPLPLLGVAGGDPRLGECTGGVIVGVRTTANPSVEVFGQRLTFVEPICGQVLRDAPHLPDAPSGTLRVTRDDARVAWATADGFFGTPATEVPDPRLVWERQPETVCPPATPVVVGLSGEYDPVAPDVPDTSAFRSLFVECAPLVIAPDGVGVAAAAAGRQLISNAEAFAAAGAESYRLACEGGAVATRLQVHAGFWLDGMLLGCSGLRIE